MIPYFKNAGMILFAILVGFNSCTKQKFSFGDIKTPTSLALTTAIAGVDATNPNGNGFGNVAITASAKDALTFNIDYGDGNKELVPSGTIIHKYRHPGTNDYNLPVKSI